MPENDFGDVIECNTYLEAILHLSMLFGMAEAITITIMLTYNNNNNNNNSCFICQVISGTENETEQVVTQCLRFHLPVPL